MGSGFLKECQTGLRRPQVDRSSVFFLVVGILSLSLGVGELIMIRRFANWDITLRGVAGIPGMFLFAGALQLSIASGPVSWRWHSSSACSRP
jgi:hypothetical protein